MIAPLHLALLAVPLLCAVFAAAQPPACIGEYSTCASGVCSLVPSQCGQCSVAGQYACPLSSTCVANADALSTCPGLAGTHFDVSLGVEGRLDYLLAQSWTVDELISQMTENATAVERLSVPAYNYLNDDQHGVKQPDATAFPNGCAMGATWNAALLTSVGNAIGVEARAVHNTETDKSGETGGEGWPGTLRNGET